MKGNTFKVSKSAKKGVNEVIDTNRISGRMTMHHNVAQMIDTNIISTIVKSKLIESCWRYKLQSKKETSVVTRV